MARPRKYAPDKNPWGNHKALDLVETLPHLGRILYPWQRKFIDSTNKMNLITAANQVGKSSALIIKNILWATSPDKWDQLFPKRKPKQFWYLYPDWGTVETEFLEKWEAEFLPRGKYKTENKQYGWEAITDKAGDVRGIKFRSGVNLWFRVYSQKKSAMMASTVSMVSFDEEIPISFLPELQARLNATNGYLNGGFTATLCQDIWLRAMEVKGEREMFKDAFKQTISLYDCLEMENGQPSPDWNEERIQKIIDNCVSENEVMRRVYGRFIAEDTLRYSAFSPERHFIKPFPIPENYSKYAAVDPGSGGHRNHPASISFIAVSPDYTVGYVYKGWRGDGVETTASDIMAKFKELRGTDKLVGQVYDHSGRDFGIIASRIGEPFVRAEKSPQLGEESVNTLFRNNALLIFDIPELQALGTEFVTLKHNAKKQSAKDDYIDSVRYNVMQVPWDWDNLLLNEIDEKNKKLIKVLPLSPLDLEIKQRRGEDPDGQAKDRASWHEFDDECNFWNEQYGNGS